MNTDVGPILDPIYRDDFTGCYLYHPDYGYIYVTSTQKKDSKVTLYGMTFNHGSCISRFSTYFNLDGAGSWELKRGFTRELKIISKSKFLTAYESWYKSLNEKLGEDLLEMVKKDNDI